MITKYECAFKGNDLNHKRYRHSLFPETKKSRPVEINKIIIKNLKTMKNKQCPYCGNEFEGRENRLYCSDKCRINAFRNGKETDNSIFLSDDETENKKNETNNLTNEMEKQIMETNNYEKKQISVTVNFSETELRIIKDQAGEFGVSDQQLIKTKSLMEANNILMLQSKINSLTDENEKHRIELNFLRKMSPAPNSQHSNKSEISDSLIRYTYRKMIDADLIHNLNDEDFEEEMDDLEENNPEEFRKRIIKDVFMDYLSNIVVSLMKEGIYHEKALSEFYRDFDNLC
jgi:predicted DNA binding CopG/RHH family protein